MQGLSNAATSVLMGMYGNFPGRGSLRERGFMGSGSSTGGQGTPQTFYGAEGAGRVGAPLGGGIEQGGVSPFFGGGGPPMMGGGAPFGSEMGGLNNSYRTRGSAPRYHEGIPMGGTPGVWAIRNDEIGGPKQDPFQNMSPRDFAEYTSRSIGNRFGRRGRR